MTSIMSLPVMPKINGYTLYSGKSLINKKPILVIATGFNNKSDNSKTGEMIQTYVLSAEQTPAKTYKAGHDVSVCGDCRHRSKYSGGLGTCYVNVAQGPQAIFNAHSRGNYPVPSAETIKTLFKDKLVRLGSYGDPCAVPIEVWEPILEFAKGHTGYTHQWKQDYVQPYKDFLMASVDTVREFALAKSKGWRTFRIRRGSDTQLLKHEFVCPASVEAGKRLNCNTCLACSGGTSKANVAIMVHGLKYKMNRFKKNKL